MASDLEPLGGDFDPIRPDRLEKIQAADVGPERQIVADGIEVLQHGALVCPDCELPVWPPHRMPAATELCCGFCGHTAQAREFLLPDVYDTVGNEVFLVARLAPSP